MLDDESDCYAHENQQSVGDGVGDGVAHCGDGGTQCILDGTEAGRGDTRSGVTTQVDGRGEVEHLVADPYSENQGHGRGDDTGHKEHRANLSDTTDESRCGRDTYDGDEEVQTQVVE